MIGASGRVADNVMKRRSSVLPVHVVDVALEQVVGVAVPVDGSVQ